MDAHTCFFGFLLWGVVGLVASAYISKDDDGYILLSWDSDNFKNPIKVFAAGPLFWLFLLSNL